MKKIVLLFLFILLCCLASCTSSNQFKDSVAPEDMLTKNEIKSKLENMLVKVYTYDLTGQYVQKQGSGLLFNKTGAFITNAHVMEDAYSAQIKKKSSIGYSWDVLSIYSYNYKTSDYCVADSETVCPVLPTFTDVYKSGDICYSIGFPKDSFFVEIHEGKIIGDVVADGVKYIENTAVTDHGSSGGVLVNAAGEVLGITTGLLDNGNYAAIPYTVFEKDVTSTLANMFNSKSVLEYFHTVKTISLNTTNVTNYFDIKYLKEQSTATSASYYVYLYLKEKYKNIVLIDDDITIKIKVTTSFKETTKYGSYSKSNTDYLTFTVNQTSTYPKTLMSYTYISSNYNNSYQNLGTDLSIFVVSGSLKVITD